MIYEVMPLLAAFQLADSVCGVAGGILRGTGRQSAGAIINVTAYYAIGAYRSGSGWAVLHSHTLLCCQVSPLAWLSLSAGSTGAFLGSGSA